MSEINFKIDELKNEMYSLISVYGTSHPATIEKSQELDLWIVEKQKLLN